MNARAILTVALLLAAPLASAQIVLPIPEQQGELIVAREGIVERYGEDGRTRRWQSPGLAHAGIAAAGARSFAVADQLANRVVTLDYLNETRRAFDIDGTPSAMAWVGSELFILNRDRDSIEKIAGDGTRSRLPVGDYPQFLRVVGENLYVYSVGDGSIHEVGTRPFAIRRSATVEPFAADFEVDPRLLYLVYPASQNVVALVMETFTMAGEEKIAGAVGGRYEIGGVPLDLALVSTGTALTAGQMAIADPDQKRVWIIEGPQSAAAAFGRGFLRGLLGIGLMGAKRSEFPTGVDRVMALGSSGAGGASSTSGLAYDSSSRSLYVFHKRKSTLLSTVVEPGAFAVSRGTVYYWNGTLVAQKLDR